MTLPRMPHRDPIPVSATWKRLLRHFELGEGFAFVMLTTVDGFTASRYADELTTILQDRQQRLERKVYATPEAALSITDEVLGRTNQGREDNPTDVLWIQAVAPATDPRMPEWLNTWRQVGARLNERRDAIRTLPYTVVMVCAEACVPAFREAAPDIWSVRTMTGTLEPILPSDAFGEIEISQISEQNSLEDISDPDLAMQAAEQARLKPDGQLELLRYLRRASRGFSQRSDFPRAMQTGIEAVEISRQLAQENPQIFNPELALSLTNLGIRFSELAQHQKALQVTQEAVEYYRELAQDNSKGFSHRYLAGSLNNLGNILKDLGRKEDALSAIQESVNIRRELAQDNPQIFRSNLAQSLNNLGNILADVRRHEEALNATQEAVNIRRELAQNDSQAFKVDLARSLHNLSMRLKNLGRFEDSLNAIQEAVVIRRELTRDNPQLFQPNLAKSLNSLGNRLNDVGKHEDAFQATQESVNIRRELAQNNLQAFKSGLAGSLNNLGIRFKNLGKFEDAINATQEAVELRRQLAQDNPKGFNWDLAQSLNNLGDRFSQNMQPFPAHRHYEEAVRTLAPLFLVTPNAFTADMTYMLRDYLKSCQATNLEPDMELIGPIQQKLEEFKTQTQAVQPIAPTSEH
jgi:tetratricopeptide (TPR) repeat protein